MFRSFFVAVAVAAGAGTAETPAPPPAPPVAATDGVFALLADESGESWGDLARVHERTLRPLGPVVRLEAGEGGSAEYSPEFDRIAVGGSDRGDAKVQLVDVRSMRSLGVVPLGLSGWVARLSWERGTLFAVVDGEQDRAVVAVDPARRKVVARHEVDGTILASRRGGAGQLVLLLAPDERIGPLRLAVVGGKGMTTTPVPGFVGGWETEQEGNEVRTRQNVPALVVDEIGRRALVVSGRAVAEISLRDLSVREHTLAEPVSLLGRLRDWLEPTAHAKVVDGPWRTGAWVGDGVFALSGGDYSTADADPEEGFEMKPAGLALVDTRDWSIRKLDEDAVGMVVTEHVIVAFGSFEQGGVTGYDLSGKERFRLLRGKSVWLQVVGGLVFAVHDDGKTVTAIDPARGKALATSTSQRPLTFVEG